MKLSNPSLPSERFKREKSIEKIYIYKRWKRKQSMMVNNVKRVRGRLV